MKEEIKLDIKCGNISKTISGEVPFEEDLSILHKLKVYYDDEKNVVCKIVSHQDSNFIEGSYSYEIQSKRN